MLVYIHGLALWGMFKNWYLHLYIYRYLHIIYRHLFIRCGNCKGKYDGLAEDFNMLSVNVSTEIFWCKFTSMSIINELYCYNLLLEQQLVAEVIFMSDIAVATRCQLELRKRSNKHLKMRVRPSERSPEKGRGRERGVEKR